MAFEVGGLERHIGVAGGVGLVEGIRCKTDHIININKLKTYIDETNSLKLHLNEFVNFVDNDIEADSEKDYYNKLKSILEQVIANKSKYNKYNK